MMEIENMIMQKKKIINVARGIEQADLVFKNACYLNVFSLTWERGDIAIIDGIIAATGGEYSGKSEIDAKDKWIVPGLIDGHIHLESAIVAPFEFAKIAISHGTTTVVTDPHEVANVMGSDGIKFMLESTENIGLDVMVCLPSCVPATPLDENYMTLNAEDIYEFYDHPRIVGLAEMMNYVGVINSDKDVLKKIADSQQRGRIIDGHAPGVCGRDLDAYVAAGVSSDHECDNYENALEKLKKGQYIMIREGTAAKNLHSLMPLLTPSLYSRCMFSTDDKHPNDLLNKGHIDYIVRECFDNKIDKALVLKTASFNAAQYFGFKGKGALAGGYIADMVVLNDLDSFDISMVLKNGKIMYENGKMPEIKEPDLNHELKEKAFSSMNCEKLKESSIKCTRKGLIGLVAGEIITKDLGYADAPNPDKDILKAVVVERHHNTGHIGIGYVKGYGLKKGAVATSVSHDSHNIIAVGSSDKDICTVVNEVIKNGGGIFVTDSEKICGLPLNICGVMSDEPLETVNEKLEYAKEFAYSLGVSQSIDPFMTLSFLSLPVIPEIKITTKGVFDVLSWKYKE